jgi:SAM-dependent methyltransferase
MLGQEYFDGLYNSDPDPWGFETREYEHRKYRNSLEALGDRRFARALEAGCSIGVFTEMLAPRCAELVAVDISPHAVRRARLRMAGRDNVRVERRRLPDEMPEGPFDLIVCSEILYYWSRPLLEAAVPALEGALAPGGTLLAVHWRLPTRTYPLQGDEVHRILRERLHLENVVARTHREYRLDAWRAR